MEVMGAWQAHYDRAAFIDMGVGDGSAVESRAQNDAARRGWVFEKITGDMVLVPDLSTGVIDPFWEAATLSFICSTLEADTYAVFAHDPRNLAQRAEAYLKSTGVGDAAYFGPEPEFFILDDVRWSIDMSGSMVKIDSHEAETTSLCSITCTISGCGKPSGTPSASAEETMSSRWMLI